MGSSVHLLLVAVGLSLTVSALSEDYRSVLFHMYMHHVFGSPGPSQTAVLITKGTGPMNPSMPAGHYFGETWAFDDPLTSGRSASSRPVGRAQGTAMLASMRRPVYVVDMVMLISGIEDYSGSTLVVVGRHDASRGVKELAITGGTEAFREASGYVLCRAVRRDSKLTVYELVVNVTVPEDDDDRPDGGPSVLSLPPVGSVQMALPWP